ncbi:hypothetical protein FHG64_06125 [Antarcticibacterium flavum]|uniref:Uncharacterized protein n=1 Tax=Antarcticibacterium flavum TaxID=2058175 RepID=A0A5B7X0Y6_9FLAO|nr:MULTISPECIES: hypothetical protein [Antarcticibacterium]QCY69017.1 hypothetical protein FHG64_06125 [Antarcticibacterium flavum]
MKITLLFLLVLTTTSGISQEVYTSHATQHFPSAEVISMDRVITVDDQKITIKSVTNENKVKIQTLQITGKVTNYDNGYSFVEYRCTTRNSRSPSTVIIKKDRPSFITLLQPSLTDHNTLEELKILLDR